MLQDATHLQFEVNFDLYLAVLHVGQRIQLIVE